MADQSHVGSIRVQLKAWGLRSRWFQPSRFFRVFHLSPRWLKSVPPSRGVRWFLLERNPPLRLATLTTPTNAPAAKPSRSVLLSQAFLKQSFDRRPSVILETLRGFDTGKDSPGDASANAETESEQKDETQMLKDAIGQELRILSRQVTLGQWEAVRVFSGPCS